jgi:hypothetical protein
MKSGDVVFLRGTGILAWIVRKVTKSQFAHVGIIWVVSDRVLMLEADPWKGVIVRPLSMSLPGYWAPGFGWNEDAQVLALESLGKSYDFIDAIRSGLGKKPDDPTKFECAEYVTTILAKIKPEFPILGTPEKLAEYMNEKMVAVN